MSHHDHRIDIDHELAPPGRLDAYHRRQLSAMLDGELSPDQTRFMLRRLQHDRELAACWERWQVCGEVLRGRGHALLPAEFPQRVAAAIATPAGAAVSGAAAADVGGPRPHRLLRWGGGALAASMALMALFMVRPLPDAGAPAPVAGMGEPAPASAGGGPSAAAPTTAGAGVAAGPTMPEAATALLAAAAPAAMTVSELPRRTAERGGSTRSQSQRAALRRSQTAAEAPVRVLAASATVAPAADLRLAPVIPAEAGDALLAGPAALAVDSDALFGGIPVATARPWPRAVLPGLSVRRPFAAGYGMPQTEAFAPFQPRVEAAAERAARRAAMAPVPPGGASAPEPGADRGTGPGLSP